ncbi:hypothetical protein QFC22_006608 [Naganishia vaughanmartiniae]|uniref:Uncharacterized protein n=1 Tax=Naganishia vaughanmartiniae TaxID=1424756 RepID=A0ACC2WHJ9_9TREE|nr:hypothetical protein QFC22_006608 [Naganishia vaughanmartiniae]
MDLNGFCDKVQEHLGAFWERTSPGYHMPKVWRAPMIHPMACWRLQVGCQTAEEKWTSFCAQNGLDVEVEGRTKIVGTTLSGMCNGHFGYIHKVAGKLSKASNDEIRNENLNNLQTALGNVMVVTVPHSEQGSYASLFNQPGNPDLETRVRSYCNMLIRNFIIHPILGPEGAPVEVDRSWSGEEMRETVSRWLGTTRYEFPSWSLTQKTELGLSGDDENLGDYPSLRSVSASSVTAPTVQIRM